MRRLWIVGIVALGGVAMLWAALASRPTPAPTPAVRRKASPTSPVKEAVPEATSTALLIREAETELLALCEERDRLLVEKNRPQNPTKADMQIRIEQAEMQIMKHIRTGHGHLNAAKPAQALESFERAEAAILRVPYEIKRLNEFLARVRAAKEKARAAMSGAATPTSTADEHYLLAEGYFQRSDFDRAKAECLRAIQADPDHLPARALRQEVEILTGK